MQNASISVTPSITVCDNFHFYLWPYPYHLWPFPYLSMPLPYLSMPLPYLSLSFKIFDICQWQYIHICLWLFPCLSLSILLIYLQPIKISIFIDSDFHFCLWLIPFPSMVVFVSICDHFNFCLWKSPCLTECFHVWLWIFPSLPLFP